MHIYAHIQVQRKASSRTSRLIAKNVGEKPAKTLISTYMCLYVCVCMCVCVYVCVCVCAFLEKNVGDGLPIHFIYLWHTYMRACIHTITQRHVNEIYTRTHTYVQIEDIKKHAWIANEPRLQGGKTPAERITVTPDEVKNALTLSDSVCVYVYIYIYMYIWTVTNMY